jgi:hypothetical protein
MRRTIAISLLMILSFGLMAPLLYPDSESALPPCCRTHGKHHCMMRMMQRLRGHQGAIGSVSDQCPCPLSSACAVQSANYKPEAIRHCYAGLVRLSVCPPDTGHIVRLSFFRDHQKRGPPAPLI